MNPNKGDSLPLLSPLNYLITSVAIIGLRSVSLLISKGFESFKWIHIELTIANGLDEVYSLYYNPFSVWIITLPPTPKGLSIQVCQIPPP